MLHPVSPRVRPSSCRFCPLHHAFCDLPDAIRAAFDDLKRTVSYRKGQSIFIESEPCHGVFAVCQGSVKLITASSEGKVLLLRLVRPGEVLGLAEAVLGGVPYECSAIAAEPSILAVIPHDIFMRFINSYPAACLVLATALSEQYRYAQRETKFLAFGETSAVRIARLLLEWCAERGEPLTDGLYLPLHMTHTELAQTIGATRETVTRIFSNLAQHAVIERRLDGIVILRPDELARFGSGRGAGLKPHPASRAVAALVS